MQYSQEHLKTMVYAEFGGQTECIMGNWKIENGIFPFLYLSVSFWSNYVNKSDVSASKNSSRNAAIQWKFENNKAYEGLAWGTKNDSNQSSVIPDNEGSN